MRDGFRKEHEFWLLFGLDIVIIIASLWVAFEALLAMRRASTEPPEEPDADETFELHPATEEHADAR